MGYCCQSRCLNAPHAWQMGWKSAAVALEGASLPVGIPVVLALPSQQSRPNGAKGYPTNASSASFAAIVADWLPLPCTLFLSYHLSTATVDVGTPGFSDGLLLHSYAGVIQSDYSETTFIGAVAGGMQQPEGQRGARGQPRRHCLTGSSAVVLSQCCSPPMGAPQQFGCVGRMATRAPRSRLRLALMASTTTAMG